MHRTDMTLAAVILFVALLALLMSATGSESMGSSPARAADDPAAGANVAPSEGTLGAPTSSMPPTTTLAVSRWSGTATWYCSDGRHGSPVSACPRGHGPSEMVAAIDRKDSPFRKGDKVTVRYRGKAVTVRIVDVCACGGARLIDLSIAAFERLAPWGSGVIPVTIERGGRVTASAGGRPRVTLPPTDTRP